MKKIALISSVGGHLEQLLSLKKVIDEHQSFIITEKNDSTLKLAIGDRPVYFLPYISRKNYISFIFYYSICICKSFYYYSKLRPQIIISTGAGCVLPFCLIGKLFGAKLIFIETFARVKSKTITGKLCYYFADVFIVQWKELLNIYPNAIYLNHIY